MPVIESHGVELLFGPMLIGVFFNTILYGVMIMQAYVYYQTYKNDATWIRYFVLYLFVVETLNTGFDIGMMYEPLIVRYATPRATIIAPLMLDADPLLTVMISSPVQLFIAWRVSVITHGSRLLPAVIAFFAVTSFIGGVATTVSVTIINKYAFFHKFDGAVITWLASSAGADIIITMALVYSLTKQRTGFSKTDDMINRIVRLTVQTGLITAISATADVTLFLALKGTTINYIWDFALSKLYTNSLLSTLNARKGFISPVASALRTTQDNTLHTSVLFGPDPSAACHKPPRIPVKARSRSHGSEQGTESSTLELSEISGAPTDLLGYDKVDHADLSMGIRVTTMLQRVTDNMAEEAKKRNDDVLEV